MPALRLAEGRGGLELAAAGAWLAPNAAVLDRQVAETTALVARRAVTVDASRIEALDTFGAGLILRLLAAIEAQGGEPKLIGLAGRFQPLFAAVSEAWPAAAPEVRVSRLGDRLRSLPPTILAAGEALASDLEALLSLLGALAAAAAHAIRHPGRFRLTSTVHQLDRVAWQAVPIILLITFLIGGIIAQQGFFHFRKFGADQYVVDMVGILVLREIGVLIVAIMVAGRSGSSYTAELGSMKMREEIDALRTMGLDPIEILMLPRIVALLLALPALAFLGALSALIGGGFVAWVYGDMNPSIFIARLHEAISLTHFKVGMIKAPFMALAIGLVACAEGLKVKGSAESLGLKTTAAVVKSIFLVIVLDGVFAMYFAAIGM